MEIKNPATPASMAAAPGSSAAGSATPSAVPQAPATQGTEGIQPEGEVTISTKEYADLQRAKARQLSFEKRREFNHSRNNSQPTNQGGEGNDPEIVEQLRHEQDARAESDKRAYRAEVTLKVHDLLKKEEFKNLPASTQNLILKNPAMLSDADNVDEALLDIEDFVREQVAGLSTPASQQAHQPGGSPSPAVPGHETPPSVSAGAPAPVTSVDEEDVSKLTGVARSRAVLRNSMRKQSFGNRK